MKSKILTSLGIAVISMALFLNTNSINDNKSNLDLASLISLNTANAEAGEGKCKAELDCGAGAKVSCEGKKECRAYSWYVECDGTRGYC